MVYDLDTFTWKALRILARAAGSPRTGKELRHAMTRWTKDGTFLDALVKVGLLVRLDTIPAAGKGPAQFRTFYALTERGERAAEYGECEFSREERSVLLNRRHGAAAS